MTKETSTSEEVIAARPDTVRGDILKTDVLGRIIKKGQTNYPSLTTKTPLMLRVSNRDSYSSGVHLNTVSVLPSASSHKRRITLSQTNYTPSSQTKDFTRRRGSCSNFVPHCKLLERNLGSAPQSHPNGLSRDLRASGNM
jgi:hypothetical protein